MADKNRAAKQESPWTEIDNTVVDVIGKRVFYQLTDVELDSFKQTRRKCVALVVGADGSRNADGQIVNTLRCWSANGDAFTVKAPLSSDRRPGSFDLAKDGDKVN